MVVIGAGVIGSEYACTFAALGTEVHVVDGRDALLPFLDADVSRALATAMERNGIIFHWKEQVRTCSSGTSGGVAVSLLSGETLTVDAVLVAVDSQAQREGVRRLSGHVKTGVRPQRGGCVQFLRPRERE
jgi:NAD(P) transhydrogenase